MDNADLPDPQKVLKVASNIAIEKYNKNDLKADIINLFEKKSGFVGVVIIFAHACNEKSAQLGFELDIYFNNLEKDEISGIFDKAKQAICS